MQVIQTLLAQDLFALISSNDPTTNVTVGISFYELYGGCVQDLLHQRQRLKVLEDGKGEINVHGLTERTADTVEAFWEILEEGNAARTTHVTQANDTSSRSHAI